MSDNYTVVLYSEDIYKIYNKLSSDSIEILLDKYIIIKLDNEDIIRYLIYDIFIFENNNYLIYFNSKKRN